MIAVIIDRKKYVLIADKVLQKQAALKTKPEKLLSVDEARAYSKKLIRQWGAEK